MATKVDTAKIGAGDVKFNLAGEEKVLKCTYRATQALSRLYNGLTNLVNDLQNLNIDAVELVLFHGLGLTLKGREGLGEKIWKTGPAKLVSPCIQYVGNLANGGQPIIEDETTTLTEEDDEKNE